MGVGADKILVTKQNTRALQTKKQGFNLAFEIGDGGFSNQGFEAFKGW